MGGGPLALGRARALTMKPVAMPDAPAAPDLAGHQSRSR